MGMECAAIYNNNKNDVWKPNGSVSTGSAHVLGCNGMNTNCPLE